MVAQAWNGAISLVPGPVETPFRRLTAPVRRATYAASLEELRNDERMSRALVLLKSDIRTTVGMERKVSEMILAAGFKMALVGNAEPTVEEEE
jgi:hypothetical protein